jgi:hypothetical protein
VSKDIKHGVRNDNKRGWFECQNQWKRGFPLKVFGCHLLH